MSVKQIRAHIQAAIGSLHEAQVEFTKTPAHRKYIEVSDFMLQVDDHYIRLRVLDMNARDVLEKVLQREGKKC